MTTQDQTTMHGKRHDRVVDRDHSAEETQAHRTEQSAPEWYTELRDDRKEELFSEDRQRERYGGLNWGAAFFGWLVAGTVAFMVTGLVGAVLTTMGMTPDTFVADAEKAPQVAAIVAGAIALLVLTASYYSGGYVAGRMSRFDGGRQGFGVWMISLVIAGLFVAVGLLMGARFDILDPSTLSALPIPSEARSIWGAAGGAVLVLVSLLAAVGGGKVGCRYHSKVDDSGYL